MDTLIQRVEEVRRDQVVGVPVLGIQGVVGVTVPGLQPECEKCITPSHNHEAYPEGSPIADECSDKTEQYHGHGEREEHAEDQVR